METNSSAASTSGPFELPHEVLLFVFQEGLWGVDVARVVRVVPAGHISPVPLRVARLTGVIKYEGQAVPVFVPPRADVSTLRSPEQDPGYLVVLLEHETGLVGCLVEGVERVARPDEFMFEDLDAEMSDVPEPATPGATETMETAGEATGEIGVATGYFVPRRARGRRADTPQGRPFTFLSVSSILRD